MGNRRRLAHEMSNSHRTYRRSGNNNISIDRTLGSTENNITLNECGGDVGSGYTVVVGGLTRLTLPAIHARNNYSHTRQPREILRNR